jgi:hypothetical protein
MATKTDPITTAIAAFPFPDLLRIGELSSPPTYTTLLKCQSQLNANSSAVDTPEGTGIHGHIVLTLTPGEFYALTETDVNDPHPHPPPANPGHIDPAATQAQARVHEERQYHYKLYTTTEKLLKKQLLAATPDLYIAKIKHPVTNYATVSTRQILNHLWATYGTITPADLDANLVTMSKPWHPSTPIESLFQQLSDGIVLATAGDCPIHDNHVVRIAYNIIVATGVFELPCRDWRALPSADKTYERLQIFFTVANKDRSATTSSVGYHSTNAVTTDHNATIHELTRSNKELTAKLAAYNKPKDSTKHSKPKPPTDKPRFEGYCHTHGTTHAPTAAKLHNSITCKNPGPNHITNATKTNKQGGSDRIWGPPQKTN